MISCVFYILAPTIWKKDAVSTIDDTVAVLIFRSLKICSSVFVTNAVSIMVRLRLFVLRLMMFWLMINWGWSMIRWRSSWGSRDSGKKHEHNCQLIHVVKTDCFISDGY